jgi:hypothetical protein
MLDELLRRELRPIPLGDAARERSGFLLGRIVVEHRSIAF